MARSRLQEELAMDALGRSRELAHHSKAALNSHHLAKEQIYLDHHLARSRQQQRSAKERLKDVERQELFKDEPGHQGKLHQSREIAAINASSMTRSRQAASLAAQRIQLARARTIQAERAVDTLYKSDVKLTDRYLLHRSRQKEVIQAAIRSSKERVDFAALKLKEQKLAQEAAEARLRSETLLNSLSRPSPGYKQNQKYEVARSRLQEQLRYKKATYEIEDNERRLALLRANRHY